MMRFEFYVNCALTERQRAILMAGGLLNYTKEGETIMKEITLACEAFQKLLEEQLEQNPEHERGQDGFFHQEAGHHRRH